MDGQSKKKGYSDTTQKSITNGRKDQTDPNKPYRILEVKTSRTGVIKQTFEIMSSVISDACLVFIPPDKNYSQKDDDDYYEEVESDEEQHTKKKKKGKGIDEKPKKNVKRNVGGGIRMVRLTEDRNIIIKLTLDSDKFDVFECEEPKITIGIDINMLHTMLKLVSDDDPITFYIMSNNRDTLYISGLTKNNDGSEETDIEISLMTINNPDLPLQATEFQNRIKIASEKFHNICKNFNNICKNFNDKTAYVDIRSIGDEISFKGMNEGGKVTKTYKDIHGKNKTGPQVIVQGKYELKNLLSFSKCNKLCDTIDIYLKNDFPLVLAIGIASLGKMYVFLSPIEDGIK